MAALAAASSLSSILPSSSLPFRGPLTSHSFHQFPSFLLSFKPNPTKPLTFNSQSHSLPLLRHLSPAGFLRSAAASEAVIEAQLDGELELCESETDQLLDQEHEQEQEEEGERTKPHASNDTRLYVGNLPYSITSAQLADIFAEAGAVRSAEVIYGRMTDRSRGFAFVIMESVGDAENAIRMFDSSQIGGRTVKVNFPEVPMGGEHKVLEPKIKTSYQTFMDTPNKIYVGNLSWSLTSQALRDVFSDQPGFLSAKVIFERDTGKSRGFGFVSFSSDVEATSAITAMNGVEVEGRPLRLNMATEKARSSPSTLDFTSEETMDQGEIP